MGEFTDGIAGQFVGLWVGASLQNQFIALVCK